MQGATHEELPQDWQLVGHAAGHRERAAPKPMVPYIGDISSAEVQEKANQDAREKLDRGGLELKKPYPWPLTYCLLFLKIAAGVQIYMQVLTILLFLGSLVIDTHRVILAFTGLAALAVAVCDIMNVRATAIPFAQEVGTVSFSLPLPNAILPQSLQSSFVAWLVWGLMGTLLYTWWLVGLPATLMSYAPELATAWERAWQAFAVGRLVPDVQLHTCMIAMLIGVDFRWVFTLVRHAVFIQETAGDRRRQRLMNPVTQEVRPAEVLHGLATCLGLQTLSQQAAPYRKARIINQGRVVQDLLDEGNQEKAMKEWGYLVTDFYYRVGHCLEAFVVMQIPKCAALHLQAAIRALTYVLIPNAPRVMATFSMAAGCAGFIPVAATIYGVETIYFERVRPDALKEDFQHVKPRGFRTRNGRDIRKWLYAFRVVYTIIIISYILAIIKFLGMFICESSLWEIHSDGQVGCMDLGTILKHGRP